MNSNLNISNSDDEDAECTADGPTNRNAVPSTATAAHQLEGATTTTDVAPSPSSPKSPVGPSLPPRQASSSIYVAYPRPVIQINGVSATPLMPSTVGRHNGFLRTYKVLLVGEAGVGKSNLMHRYCYNQYDPSLPSTIGAEFCSREVDIPAGPVGQTESVVLQLWDTAGQERNAGVISNAFYRNAVGAIVVYDVTRRESLLNVPRWVARVMELACEDCVCVVVGTKVDLLKTAQGAPLSKAELDALQQEADGISHALGMRNFFASALSGEGVLEAFTHLVLAVDAVQAAPPEIRREAAAAAAVAASHAQRAAPAHGGGLYHNTNHSNGSMAGGNDPYYATCGRGLGPSRVSEMWTAASTVPASPVALLGGATGRRWSEEPSHDAHVRTQSNYNTPQPNGSMNSSNAATYPYNCNSHVNHGSAMSLSQGSPGMTPSASGYMSPGTVGNSSSSTSPQWRSPVPTPGKQKKPLDLRGFGPGEGGQPAGGAQDASWGC